MKEQPSYYAIIPANVRYDDGLKANEKLMYGEITCLSAKNGVCWAGNAYFAELYGVAKETVSRWVSNLQSKGYIRVEVIRNDKKQIIKRVIRLSVAIDEKIKSPIAEKIKHPIDENIKDNTTSNNNTRYNTTRSDKPKNKVPPSLEEVKEYFRERQTRVNPVYFFNHYEANGWVRGKNKIKNWKACLTVWETRNGDQPSSKKNKIDTIEKDRIDLKERKATFKQKWGDEWRAKINPAVLAEIEEAEARLK